MLIILFCVALYALKLSAFGPGSGYIWLNNVDCQGSEAHLVNCSYSTDTTMCDHSREAGVKCMPGMCVLA